jgi:hypothetical protein
MPKGGIRQGAGRKFKPKEFLRKKRSLYATDSEWALVRVYIQSLREK